LAQAISLERLVEGTIHTPTLPCHVESGCRASADLAPAPASPPLFERTASSAAGGRRHDATLNRRAIRDGLAVEFGGRGCDEGVVFYEDEDVETPCKERADERRHGLAVGEERRSTCGYGVALADTALLLCLIKHLCSVAMA